MRIGFFIFPGFQLLDLSGPHAAFEIAQRFHGCTHYELNVVSLSGGLIASSGGIQIDSRPLHALSYDTLLIVGGDQLASTEQRIEGVGPGLRQAARHCRRVASICTGAYLLAESGLLDGKRVTTHWRFAEEMQRRWPALRLEPDRIFIRDGSIWTSAGITAGIDLALALIGDDVGELVARGVARDLVVFHRRPGGQSQYSALLEIEGRSERIGSALSYAREHLAAPLTVEELASQAHLSPRQFARIFREETGTTPAKAIEQLRVEAARIRVEDHPSESIEDIAQTTGFGDIERMRRAFLRAFQASPRALRTRALRDAATLSAPDLPTQA